MNLNTLSYYWREAFSSIVRNSWLSVASVGTVTVSLMILGFFSLIVINSNSFTREIESGLEIRVFLEEGQSRESVRNMQAEIQKMPGVSLVDYISKEQALEEMRTRFGSQAGVLDGLQNDNPLPEAFKISAVQADLIPELADKIAAMDGVDQVVYGQGLVERLISATRWIRLASAVVLGFLCVAAVFLISTTIRMSAYARRKEISIMVLLGATNWFVRFPYLLEGMMLGLVGALLAGSVVYAGYISLAAHIGQSLPFVHPVTDRNIIWSVMGAILGFGLVIGALGSSLSIRKFMKI
ncbi:MAG: permease-like cell division protein FtsX [Bacillota bacterium]